MPTIDEYITSKIDSIRTAALNKSRTRKLPKVPYGFKDDQRYKANDLRNFANFARYKAEDAMSSAWMDSDTKNHIRLMHLREAAELEKEAKDYESGKKLAPGLSCIGTATDNYGNEHLVYGNQTFAKNPKKYGFIKIPMSNAEGGDLIQAIGWGNIPNHTMIYDGTNRNGVMLVNYSNGGIGEKAIVRQGVFDSELIKGSKYAEDNYDAYKFVGTPADSLKWRTEYQNLYDKKLGGIINNKNMSTKNKRKKAALGDYEDILAPTIVSAQGRRTPDLSTYNRVIGNPVPPIIDTSVPDIPIEVPEFSPLDTTVKVAPIYTPSLLERYGLNKGDVVAGGIQLAGNLASSLINQAAINKLRFTPIHTMTVAEAPVKFDTNYNINPQLDELREMEAANEREIRDNTASSQNVVGRTIGSRFRTNRGYNELYGHKLNQQAAIKNAEAQNRQGVYQRNTDRLQQNITRDTLYNTQGEDNLRNTKATLTGQNWSNFAQQATGSLIGAYNRGQQRISDANSLGLLLASNPNSANLFMNNNSLINRIFRTARRMQGING